MRLRAAVTVVTAAVLLGSAAPAGAKVYGGSFRLQDWPIVVRASPTVVQSATVQWVARCPGNDLIAWHGELQGSRATARPAQGLGFYAAGLAKHRFRAKLFGTIDWGAGVSGTLSGTLGGKLGRSSAQGFLSGVISYVDTEGTGRRCYIGPSKWYGESSPLVYAGDTQEAEPIVFTLAPGRHAVAQASVAWTTAGCNSGDVSDVTARLGRMPLVPVERLDSTPFLDLTYADGSRAQYGYRVTGQFGGAAAEGTLAVSARFLDAHGQVTDYCSGVQRTWSADRTG